MSDNERKVVRGLKSLVGRSRWLGDTFSQVEALLPRYIHAVTARGLILKTLCCFLATAFKAFV